MSIPNLERDLKLEPAKLCRLASVPPQSIFTAFRRAANCIAGWGPKAMTEQGLDLVTTSRRVLKMTRLRLEGTLQEAMLLLSIDLEQ
jgi:hypothetical protein